MIFKKKNLSKIAVVNEPGTYIVKCNTANHFLYTGDDHPRYLINLRASTAVKLDRCLKIMGSNEEVDYHAIKDCFITGTIWPNQIDNDEENLPVKGESLIATFDEVEGSLLCTAITLIPRQELELFNLEEKCKTRKMISNLLKNDTQ